MNHPNLSGRLYIWNKSAHWTVRRVLYLFNLFKKYLLFLYLLFLMLLLTLLCFMLGTLDELYYTNKSAFPGIFKLADKFSQSIDYCSDTFDFPKSGLTDSINNDFIQYGWPDSRSLVLCLLCWPAALAYREWANINIFSSAHAFSATALLKLMFAKPQPKK